MKILITAAYLTALFLIPNSKSMAQSIHHISNEVSIVTTSIETISKYNDGENLLRLNREADSRTCRNTTICNRSFYTISGQIAADGEIEYENIIFYLPSIGDWSITGHNKTPIDRIHQSKRGVTFQLDCKLYDSGKAEHYTFYSMALRLVKGTSPDAPHAGVYIFVPGARETYPSWSDADIVRMTSTKLIDVTQNENRLRILQVKEAFEYPDDGKMARKDTLYFSVSQSYEEGKYWSEEAHALVDVYFVELADEIQFSKYLGNAIFTIIHRVPVSTAEATQWTYRKLLVHHPNSSGYTTQDLGPVPHEQWKPEWGQLPQRLPEGASQTADCPQ